VPTGRVTGSEVDGAGGGRSRRRIVTYYARVAAGWSGRSEALEDGGVGGGPDAERRRTG